MRDLWIYFKTGHGGYLVYTISLLNFVVIQHRLLISYVPFLSKYLSELGKFALVFLVSYVPTAICLGYFDFRKGEMKRRPQLNEYTQDTIESTMLTNIGLLAFFNGDLDRAQLCINKSVSVLQKWKVGEIRID